MIKASHALFKDKTTLILRELLSKPLKKWNLRELAGASGASLGLVSRTINLLDKVGYVERGGVGCKGFTILKKREELLENWSLFYDYSFNKVTSFYITRDADVKYVVNFLKSKKILYALTLHSGANLLTNYFSFEQYHLYVDYYNFEKLATELSSGIFLKRLSNGGNLHFIKPYYKTSAYWKMQSLKGLNVVSNLQLYLDLYHFSPRGKEHASFLKETLAEKLYE